MILKVFVVATEAKASDFIVPIVIDRVTFETGVISYMAVHLALVMSPSCLVQLLLRLGNEK